MAYQWGKITHYTHVAEVIKEPSTPGVNKLSRGPNHANFLFLYKSFIGTHSCPFVYKLSVATFSQQ